MGSMNLAKMYCVKNSQLINRQFSSRNVVDSNVTFFRKVDEEKL